MFEKSRREVHVSYIGNESIVRSEFLLAERQFLSFRNLLISIKPVPCKTIAQIKFLGIIIHLEGFHKDIRLVLVNYLLIIYPCRYFLIYSMYTASGTAITAPVRLITEEGSTVILTN